MIILYDNLDWVSMLKLVELTEENLVNDKFGLFELNLNNEEIVEMMRRSYLFEKEINRIADHPMACFDIVIEGKQLVSQNNPNKPVKVWSTITHSEHVKGKTSNYLMEDAYNKKHNANKRKNDSYLSTIPLISDVTDIFVEKARLAAEKIERLKETSVGNEYSSERHKESSKSELKHWKAEEKKENTKMLEKILQHEPNKRYAKRLIADNVNEGVLNMKEFPGDLKLRGRTSPKKISATTISTSETFFKGIKKLPK